jgi:uroporphyrinogen-III decarboxylase
MYIVSYENGLGNLVPIAVASSREVAESIVKKLQSAAYKNTSHVFYNGCYVNTDSLDIEYVPEWKEAFLHKKGRMS